MRMFWKTTDLQHINAECHIVIFIKHLALSYSIDVVLNRSGLQGVSMHPMTSIVIFVQIYLRSIIYWIL